MKSPGLDHRHRDRNVEISRKHGNTHVGTLRKHYGAGFASGFKDADTLTHVLATLDEPSLTKLIRVCLRMAQWTIRRHKRLPRATWIIALETSIRFS